MKRKTEIDLRHINVNEPSHFVGEIDKHYEQGFKGYSPIWVTSRQLALLVINGHLNDSFRWAKASTFDLPGEWVFVYDSTWAPHVFFIAD